VRITAQLIDAESGFHLWSETYDRRLEDIFQVQDEIAAAIVDKLRIELAPQEQALAVRDKAPTQNVEAYELYLQGRAVWKRRGEDNLRQAIALFQRSIGLDPAFARAYAALASAYVVLPGYTSQTDDEAELLPMAESAARQALSIDPKIGEAHAVLAQINSERGDLLDAESGFFFAISLEPNEATPHQWYSILLGKVGRLNQALEQARRAYELDPTSPIIAANLAATYLVRGDNDQALRYSRLAAELGLSKANGGVLAQVALRRGDWAEAREQLARQDMLPAEMKALLPRYVDAWADPAFRPRVIAEMRAIDPKIAKQMDLVPAYIELGASDVAYDVVFKALGDDPRAWAGRWDAAIWGPEGVSFRRDPRFGELARRIGLEDYWKQYGYPDGCRAGADTLIECS
jgi:tetratricopeptide (TPR) repeat protein